MWNKYFSGSTKKAKQKSLLMEVHRHVSEKFGSPCEVLKD